MASGERAVPRVRYQENTRYGSEIADVRAAGVGSGGWGDSRGSQAVYLSEQEHDHDDAGDETQKLGRNTGDVRETEEQDHTSHRPSDIVRLVPGDVIFVDAGPRDPPRSNTVFRPQVFPPDESAEQAEVAVPHAVYETDGPVPFEVVELVLVPVSEFVSVTPYRSELGKVRSFRVERRRWEG